MVHCTMHRVWPSRLGRGPAAAVLLAAALVARAPSARAHADVRGILLPSLYGGALEIGTLIWSEPRDAWLTGTTRADGGPDTRMTQFYAGTGVAYGIGPNTIVGVYDEYAHRESYTDGTSTFDERGLDPWSVIVQQRVWRHDGIGARTDLAVQGRVYFFAPGDAEWPEIRPTRYVLAAGVTRTGPAHFASASWWYTGAGYEPAMGAMWQGNLAVQLRPFRSWPARGRDLFAGVETNYRTSADGTRQRLVVGPSIAVVPLRPLWLQAFYGRPVYEKVDPAGAGGGSSLWLRAYVVR